MYCGKCGAEVLEDAAFCGACGAPLPQGQGPDVGKKGLGRGGKIALILVAAGVLIAALVLLWVCVAACGNGPKDVAVALIHASMDEDGLEDLVDLMPPALVRQIMREEGYDSRRELVRAYEPELEMRVEDYEDYFGDYQVKTKVLDVTYWDDDQLQEFLDIFDGENLLGKKVTQVAEVSMEVTVDGRRQEETYQPTIQVFQVDGKWCVLDAWDDPWYSF